MQSNSIAVDGGQLHFLHAGSGPPIFLLHASPMSASSLGLLIEALSKTHTVIAVDTPGYGASTAPSSRPTHIGSYAERLHILQERLGLSKVGIYGTATGAQIGIKYALDYPKDVAHLFLDNSAHFSDDERQAIYASYFPDLTPIADGSHLNQIWLIADNLFEYFPWCFQKEKYKLSTPKPPVSILHRVAIEYIKSGADYDWAYRAAFAYEDRERVYELKVPTHIFRWEASILKLYTDRIFEKTLPSNVDYSTILATQDRNQQMALTINKYYNGPDANLNLEPQPTQSSEEISIPAASFPSPEKTGRYLLEAWNMIDDEKKNLSIDEKTKVFLKWAETI